MERIPSVIQGFENVLTKPEQDYVVKKVFGGAWTFSGQSAKQSFRFWSMDLRSDSFFVNTFFARVCALTGRNLVLEHVYANGQTYGLPGSFHTDHDADDAYTFLYYANPEWDLHWGGNTIFETGETTLPAPNGAIFFPAKIAHYGSEPTRHFTGLRATVAFKVRLSTAR